MLYTALSKKARGLLFQKVSTPTAEPGRNEMCKQKKLPGY